VGNVELHLFEIVDGDAAQLDISGRQFGDAPGESFRCVEFWILEAALETQQEGGGPATTGRGFGQCGYNRRVGQRKAVNPFYVLLLPVGVVFAVTACAYLVMIMRGRDPQRAAETGLMALMAKRGVMIMAIEIGVLAVLTGLAIASDDFWTRRYGDRNRGDQ
jgi:hypothetical protein